MNIFKPEKIVCRHCKRKFIPDYRNKHHQQYCSKPACRLASKKHSQEKWLAKNPGFFCGHEHVIRVQIWRREKGRGRGRVIFKMVLEFFIFRKKGRRDTVKIIKRDGKGHMLQDISTMKSTIKTHAILQLVRQLQDIMAELFPKSYLPVKKGTKAQRRGGKKWRHKTLLKRLRTSTARR